MKATAKLLAAVRDIRYVAARVNKTLPGGVMPELPPEEETSSWRGFTLSGDDPDRR